MSGIYEDCAAFKENHPIRCTDQGMHSISTGFETIINANSLKRGEKKKERQR